MRKLSFPTPKTTRSTRDDFASQATKRYVTPAISLARPSKKEFRKDDDLEFELRTNPTADCLPHYKLTVPLFSHGTPKELLLLIKALRKVVHGQNATTGPSKYALARRVLQGDALAAFNEAAEQAGNESNDNFELALRGLITHVFPRKALLNQKRYMRRYLRKPQDMPIREFMNRLTEINEYLPQFPPFDGTNKLSVEEIMEIAEYATPNQWQKAMVLHGFDPSEHTPAEFVEFCERLEFAEVDTYARGDKHSTTKHEGMLKTSTQKRRRNSNEKYCEYHGAKGHNTGECKVVIAQAKKMRASWDSRSPHKKHYPNKTWNKSEKAESKNSKNTAFLQEAIQKAVQEALIAERKQQSEIENLNVDDFENLNLDSEEDSE